MQAARDPVGRALWFIENHFADEIRLDDVAAASGVSRYHLSRAFAIVTGVGLARYVRGRRLSEAARALAAGAPDILTVALDVGYGSHEAFSRAFRERFGVTPDTIRRRGALTNLDMTEALRMDTSAIAALGTPRFERVRALHLAGLGEHYTSDAIAGIPAQWQRFAAHIEASPQRISVTTYGVVRDDDEVGRFEYICAVEVRGFDGIAADWSRVTIANQRYAVFRHRDHVSAVKTTMVAIWNQWLPASNYEAADAPTLERYDESFDPRTGLGGFEIWLPIQG